jgi:hypothetical protein
MEVDELTIVVRGEAANLLFQPIVDIQLCKGLEMKSSNVSGSIYMSNNRDHHGAMYARGLFVGQNKELKKFELVVDLDYLVSRDRHMVPSSLWLDVNSVLSSGVQHVKNGPDGEPDHIYRHFIRVLEKLQKQDVTNGIREVLREYIAKKQSAIAADVYFVSEQDSFVAEKLSVIGKHPFLHDTLAEHVQMDRLVNYYISTQEPVALEGEEAKICAKVLELFAHSIQLSIENVFKGFYYE